MSEALRFNEGKPWLSEVFKFGKGLEHLARVMELGAIKYELDNWLKGGKPSSEYLDSGARHLAALARGDEYDPESGCHHAAHVVWNMLAYLTLNFEGPTLDPEFDLQALADKYNEGETHVLRP